MTEQFFWISKYGDAIYLGYGMEKIEELKIDFSNNKELEPLIIIQYVSEDFINSMVLLKDLNNIFYINEPFWTVDTIFWSKINTKEAFGKFLFYQLKTIDFANLNVGSAVPMLRRMNLATQTHKHLAS